MSAEDLVLAQQIISGDEEAFEAFYSRYSGEIYRHVLGIVKNRADAEDLTQEVFLRAFSSMRTYSGHASLGRWLRKVATNICIDMMRKRKLPVVAWPAMVNKDGDEQPVDFPDIGDELPLNVVEAMDGKDAILRAIECLPDYYKDSIILHDVLDYTGEEVARRMSCPVGTVKSRLSRARNILQELLLAGPGGRNLSPAPANIYEQEPAAS